MAKGEKTGGRKKGTPNKLTASIRDAIEIAFEKAGGAEYLGRVAASDPRTFCALLGRVLPTQVTGEGGGPIKTEGGLSPDVMALINDVAGRKG